MRLENGRKRLEEAAVRAANDGQVDWLFAVEYEMDFDLLHLRHPGRPNLISLDQQISQDGLSLSHDGDFISMDSDVDWETLDHTEVMNAVDTAILTWNWGAEEGALVRDDESQDIVRKAGMFRHEAPSPA